MHERAEAFGMWARWRKTGSQVPSWYWWALGVGVAALPLLLGMEDGHGPAHFSSRAVGVHTVLEFFSLATAFMVATMAWHTFDHRPTSSSNLLMAGLMVVGTCDLLHVLTYKGMPDFLTPSDTERSIFFWLMGRSFEVATIAAVGLGVRSPASKATSATAGAGVSLFLVLYGSYALNLFPSTYEDERGLTGFKVAFEAVLCVVNAVLAVTLLLKARAVANATQLELLSLAAALTAIGGVAFATYETPTSPQNTLAHLYKIAAYALLYRASYLSVLRAPYVALKESEARVRESQSRLQALGANLPNMVLYQMTVSPEGARRFTQVSDSISRVCGLDAADVERDAALWYGQMLPEDAAGFIAAEQQALDTRQPFDETARFKIADGRIRTMRIVSAPRRTDDGRVIWDGFLADVTANVESAQAQKTLEAQLRDAQRLESVGTLASGIAHDFNNVLAVMLGNIAMALEDARRMGNQGQLVALDQAQRAGQRARNLVRQILTFSRKQAVEMAPQKVGVLVADSVELLKATIPAGVDVQVDIEDPQARALLDRTQLEQVVINLCTNAWHALDGRRDGQIQVGVRSCQLSGEVARACSLMPGRYVDLWVADNGCGMDEATLKRVFEPFFTTKPIGEGTGLGLAVVHGIVESHRGAIHIHSEPGKGTRFDIYLPALVRIDMEETLEGGLLQLPAPQRTERQPAVTHGVEGTGHGERVLYIDDVEIMALMVERLLTRANYNVSVAKTAEEGLALFKEHAAEWDLLVTDFNMPLLSGLDVIREVKKLRPDLPTILTSGYVTEELLLRAQELGVTTVLEKQNTFEELGRSLQSALRKAAGTARAGA